MVHVRIRRRLAIAFIIVFLAASVALTYLAAHRYSPEALRARAERDFEAATGFKVALGKAGVSVKDTVTFADAVVYDEEGQYLACGIVTLTGLPALDGPWRLRRIEVETLTVPVDLSEFSAGRKSLRVLSGLLDKASSIEIALPENFEVHLSYSSAATLQYAAASAVFLRKRMLELNNPNSGPRDYSLIVSIPEAVLEAPIDSPGDALVQAVEASAGNAVLVRTADPTDGRLTAAWDEDSETVEFSNPSGWTISDAETLNFTGGTGSLHARINSFTAIDGNLAAFEGSFEYSADEVASKTLSEWLAAVGLAGLTGENVPPAFENVRVAADFALADRVLSVKPAAGKPALIWSEVDGQTIVIFAAEAHAPFAEVVSAVKALPSYAGTPGR